MKTLPQYPYLQNIVAEYRRQFVDRTDGKQYWEGYQEWLSQFGFKVPANFNVLEFPDDFSDEKLTMFILRWS